MPEPARVARRQTPLSAAILPRRPAKPLPPRPVVLAIHPKCMLECGNPAGPAPTRHSTRLHPVTPRHQIHGSRWHPPDFATHTVLSRIRSSGRGTSAVRGSASITCIATMLMKPPIPNYPNEEAVERASVLPPIQKEFIDDVHLWHDSFRIISATIDRLANEPGATLNGDPWSFKVDLGNLNRKLSFTAAVSNPCRFPPVASMGWGSGSLPTCTGHRRSLRGCRRTA